MRAVVASCFALALGVSASFFACNSDRSSSSTGGAGGSASTGKGGAGAGGACPTMPEAQFELVVTAATGALPADTTIAVTWSAEAEPLFVLDDPSTWMTLETANIVCDDASIPDPHDLAELDCALWTSGVTEVKVTAKGYVTYDEMLEPKLRDGCAEPFPKTVEIKLERATDAGT